VVAHGAGSHLTRCLLAPASVALQTALRHMRQILTNLGPAAVSGVGFLKVTQELFEYGAFFL
jgi:hypothetical protein